MTSLTPFAGPAPRDASRSTSPRDRDLAASVPTDSPPGRDAFSLTRQSNGNLPRERLRAGIINCLRQAGGGRVSCEEMAAWLWADDESGVPEDPHNDIRVTIHRLRKEGFPIITNWSLGYSYGWTHLEYADEGSH
jgi:hypothetical protein